MRYREIISEKVIKTTVSHYSLMTGRVQKEMLIWEAPNLEMIATLCNKFFAMDGDPNLRGVAHKGNVWVCDARDFTHADILEGVGLWDGQTPFNYQDAAFSFFCLYGSKLIDGGGPVYISVAYHDEAVKSSPARRWKAKFAVTGPWMPQPY